jgi:hypothetical protein
VLTAALTEAVSEAVAAGGDQSAIELAISETIDISGAPPAVAQAALTGAQSNLAAAGISSPAVTAAIDSQIEVASNDQGNTGAGPQGQPTDQTDTNPYNG